MGVSSARPDNLERFSSRSRSADHQLNSALRTLIGAYDDFQGENRWGTLDADSLISAFGRHIRGNGFTARWVAQIAPAAAARSRACPMRRSRRARAPPASTTTATP